MGRALRAADPTLDAEVFPEMYQIAICDDDDAFLAGFEPMLRDALAERGAAYRLTRFCDPQALLNALDCGRQFSLIFLDIVFDTERGLKLGRTLRSRREDVDIVFMTSCPDYALEAYDVLPLHFLKKPIDPEKLGAALERFLEKRAPQSIVLSTPKGPVRLILPDVLYFESCGHEIAVHMADGSASRLPGVFKALESALPPLTFVRSHRCFLVNLEHIRGVGNYRLRLSTGDELPISRRLYRQTQERFISYADKRFVTL